VTINKSELMGT